MAKVTYIQPDGTSRTCVNFEGMTLMHLAVGNLVDGIDALCGGMMQCATCHCYIDPEWLDRVGAAPEAERAMLEVFHLAPTNAAIDHTASAVAMPDPATPSARVERTALNAVAESRAARASTAIDMATSPVDAIGASGGPVNRPIPRRSDDADRPPARPRKTGTAAAAAARSPAATRRAVPLPSQVPRDSAERMRRRAARPVRPMSTGVESRPDGSVRIGANGPVAPR